MNIVSPKALTIGVLLKDNNPNDAQLVALDKNTVLKHA